MVPGESNGISPSRETLPTHSVRAQLDRILSSKSFVSSHRLCRLLRFLVERTLENDTARLKEFVVALEVFDRDENYDPSIDSIVRVEARRLRAKLKTYYEGEGREDAIRISLQPGSYVPAFHETPPAQTAPAACTAVAVLPFVNMSPDPDQDYFCDGITEEILNALASIPDLAVVARTSSFQFKGQSLDIREVASRLGAQLVIEGSVRKAGDQLRITAQAIDAANGYHLWSETYREAAAVFAIQEEIARAIALTVRVKLPPQALRRSGAHQPSTAAHNGFLKALLAIHQQNLPGLYASIAQFRDLIRQYPDYAEPYAGIATAYAALSLAGVVSGREIAPELRRNAEHALHLNPDSADAWTVLGGISANWEFDWIEAQRRFERAIALQPSSLAAHSWYAMVLTILGCFREAEAELELTLRLNPLGASGYARQGFLAYLRGDDALALSLSRKALLLEPAFTDARLTMGFAYLRQADHQASVEILSRDTGRTPAPLLLGALAAAFAHSGHRDRWTEIIARLQELSKTQYVTPLAQSCAYLGLHDFDRALDFLEAAIDDRCIFASFVNVHPYYEPLRKHPRFQAVLNKLNLSPTP